MVLQLLTPEETVHFHGHAGPFLALGYKAGLYAKDKLKPQHIKDLVCIVRVPLRTPYSCIIDGIQCSSCCTIGKRNLILEDSDSMEVRFMRADKELVLRVKKEVLQKILNIGLDDGFSLVLNSKIEELFEVEYNGGFK